MLITKVELKDVKSYAKSGPIWFAQGVNAISGPTGAGKSTILEAIGFALFDTLPYVQRQFVREGAKRGEVVVGFVDALDEREYQIVRPVAGGSLYVYDPEIQRRIAAGKGDVLDWLKEHLRVDRTADLSALFTDAVGVPQGLLTAAFLERPRGRKRKFDPLLQVDEYELAWEQLRESAGYLKDQLEVQDLRMAELRTQLKRLPQLEGDAEKLHQAITADEQRLAKLMARLEQVVAEKATMDTARDRIEKLSRQLAVLTRGLEGLDHQLSDADRAVDEAKQARQIVKDTEHGYHLHVKAQERLSQLEEQRQERDQLKVQLAEIEKALALAEQEIKRLEQTLEEIAQAEKRMAELEPLVAQQMRLQEDLKAAERGADRWAVARQRMSEEQAKLGKLEAELQGVQQGLRTLRVIQAEIEEKEPQRLELERGMATLTAGLGQMKDQRQQVKGRLEVLERAEGAECPVCRRPLEAHQAEELSEHCQAELARLDDQAEEIRRRLLEQQKELSTVDGRLAELRAQAQSLPYPAREAELTQRIEAQQSTVKEWQNKEATLASAPRLVSRLTRGLEELGDPRDEYQGLRVEAEKRAKSEADLAAAAEERMRGARARAEIEESLRAFAQLDEEVATQREAMTTSQTDHRRYLEHLRIAQALDQRRARVDELQTEKQQVATQQKKAEAELEEARASYDEAHHQELTAKYQLLSEERAALKERLVIQRERLAGVRSEIEELQQLQVELKAVEGECDSLKELAETLEFIRNTIREAGPYVTRALVQTISVEAERIFGDIMNDHTMRLSWGEDYGISVEQRGSERDFSQLSGGEKTAAALAVRLALLREMSDIRIAFFDEPTAHLDDERRENLARQITQIKGFHQLFVISHDDTFERDTHHVLRVSKENGISRVEVG